MLYKTTSPQLRSESTSFNTLDPKYKAFITRLESSNYFEGELVGSKKYVEKELFARKGWESSLIDDSCVLPFFFVFELRLTEEADILIEY